MLQAAPNASHDPTRIYAARTWYSRVYVLLLCLYCSLLRAMPYIKMNTPTKSSTGVHIITHDLMRFVLPNTLPKTIDSPIAAAVSTIDVALPGSSVKGAPAASWEVSRNITSYNVATSEYKRS